ncbi:MAG TPA: zinc-ribbon domain-containing protein, partial [Candidatus Binataceae bacterium]
MITCPECGQQAADDAKFCDRCGQGLSAAVSAPTPTTHPVRLGVGAKIKERFEITELIGQTSNENRYRARRLVETPGSNIVVLRERLGPVKEPIDPAGESKPAEPAAAPVPEQKPVAEEVDPDPNGPRAKTAELKPIPVQANGETSNPAAKLAAVEIRTSAEGLEITSAASEGKPEQAPPAENHGAETAQPTAEANLDGSKALESMKAEGAPEPAEVKPSAPIEPADLGDVFGRVLALSLTLNHPAFQRALEGFGDGGRVYLVYPDEQLAAVRRRGETMSEPEALSAAIQLCQAISFVHKRGLRLNDICPESVALSSQGRIKLTGLEYVSNDNELQSDPIFNDGYTAPEIYRSRRMDKRADIFSAGALLYTWLTGERIASESWREEAGLIRFYPPHVVTPALEQAIRRALMFDARDRWPTIDDFKTELIRLSSVPRLRCAVLTDVGRVRELNEDSAMAVEYRRDSLVDPAENYLYVVADGMGGAEAGETASAIAVGTIRDYVENRLAGGEVDLCKLMIAALEEANQKII